MPCNQIQTKVFIKSTKPDSGFNKTCNKIATNDKMKCFLSTTNNREEEGSLLERAKMSEKLNSGSCCACSKLPTPQVKGRRVKEVEIQIDGLRECNNLLISHIRKLSQLSYPPTTRDLDYLQYLFQLDQKLVQELGISLAQGKRALDKQMRIEVERKHGLNYEYHYHCQADANTRAQKERDESDYFVVIEYPHPRQATNSERIHGPHCHSELNKLYHEHKQSTLPTNKGSHFVRSDFNEHANLSDMEMDLQRMKKRLEKLIRQEPFEQQQNTKFDGIDDDSNLYSKLKQPRRDKKIQEESRKVTRCTIS